VRVVRVSPTLRCPVATPRQITSRTCWSAYQPRGSSRRAKCCPRTVLLVEYLYPIKAGPIRMATFSEIDQLGLSQPQLDFVDIDPNSDLPLFIDPYAISTKSDTWSQQCDAHIVSFFDTALEEIRRGNEQRAKLLLNGLSEPNETCLGMSSGPLQGRGVSGKQAIDLYEQLAQSQAAQSGLLSEIAECDLFVPGIGPDKISDITTNIIRRLLIEYTQSQCTLHGVGMQQVASGRYWNIAERRWNEEFVHLPVIEGRRIILVPKYSVRRRLALNGQEFYNHFILNFLQEQEEQTNAHGLVHVLKNGKRRVFKKDVKERYPFSKDFLAAFSENNPEVLRAYKEFYKNLPGAQGVLSEEDLDEEFNETAFAQALIAGLRAIPAGTDAADQYHSFMSGALEFLFWPNLIYPKKEAPIHEGRKRIDITYTNAATAGFFYRAHTAHEIASNMIMVECKNYSADPRNPELDQLGGRFSVNRGRLGLLVFRTANDYNLILRRCRDTAADGRGFVLPLSDSEIIECLALISEDRREAIDERLEQILRSLIV
jgi:hypothetical protein